LPGQVVIVVEASLASAKRNSRVIFGGNAIFVLIFSFIDGNCFSNFNDKHTIATL
jgi:hypothetical protein